MLGNADGVNVVVSDHKHIEMIVTALRGHEAVLGTVIGLAARHQEKQVHATQLRRWALEGRTG